MMSGVAQRSTPEAIGRAAVDDLASALRQHRLTVQLLASPSDRTHDLEVTGPTGEPLATVTVKGAAVVTPERAAALGHFTGSGPFDVGVVVADQISAEAKRRLRRAGWGFYDRRGDLALRTPRLVVEASLPRARKVPTRGGSPLGTRAGLTLACALLLDPTTPVVLRDVARRSGLDPGDMSSRRPRPALEVPVAWRWDPARTRAVLGGVGALASRPCAGCRPPAHRGRRARRFSGRARRGGRQW